MDDLHLGDNGSIESITRHRRQIETRALMARQVGRRVQALLDLKIANMLSGAAIPALSRGSGQALELVAGAEDVVADEEVEEERADDADPDEEVVRVDSDFIPLVVDPAPELWGVVSEKSGVEGEELTVASP